MIATILRFLIPFIIQEALKQIKDGNQRKDGVTPMNEATAGMIRHLLTFAGGILAAHYAVGDGAMIEAVAGALTTIIGAAWSIYAKRRQPQQ